ncbi:MAG: TRAP transporter large permease subunit [Candidatus Eisenbacteria bacterium]
MPLHLAGVVKEGDPQSSGIPSVLNVFLLIVGCLMDIFSALIVVVPLIVPLAQQYGVNLVHLGIIFLTNLEIGYSTPPVGLNLFISSFRFRRPVVEVYGASVPWLLMMLAALFVITYLPDLSLAMLRWIPVR